MSPRMGLFTFTEQAVGSVFWGKSVCSHMVSKLLWLLGKYQILCILLCVCAMYVWSLWKSEDIRSSEAGVQALVRSLVWLLRTERWSSVRAAGLFITKALQLCMWPSECASTQTAIKLALLLGNASMHFSLQFVCYGSIFSSSTLSGDQSCLSVLYVHPRSPVLLKDIFPPQTLIIKIAWFARQTQLSSGIWATNQWANIDATHMPHEHDTIWGSEHDLYRKTERLCL